MVDTEEVLGREDPTKGQHEEFLLRKNWINGISDDLDENLLLFFRVMVGFRNFPNGPVREKLWLELSTAVKSDKDVMIARLKHIQTIFGFARYKVLQRYQHILKAVQNLRCMVPTGKRVPQHNKRKKTLNESLQWITNILASRARIRNLTKKIHAMQSEIEETQLELLMLQERSTREIDEINEKSELKLSTFKQSEDERFAALQEEASRKILDLDQMDEYRDLVNERDQKRRKMTKLTVQLQQWMKEYDKFVGEPMKDLQPMEDEANQFAEWKKAVYLPQKDKLEQLKVRVEMWKSEQLKVQVEQFRKEHAARVLQRAWRGVLEKRKSKNKKKKKGKKGSKRKGLKKK